MASFTSWSSNVSSNPEFRTDRLMQNLRSAALFLGMLYLIVIFLVWRGVKRVFHKTPNWNTLKIFCLALLIVPFLRASAFIVHFLIYEVDILGPDPPQLLKDLIMNSLYIGPTMTYQFSYMVLICLWIEITIFSRDQFLIQHDRYNCLWKCVWGTICTLVLVGLSSIFIWASVTSNYDFVTGLYTSLWIMTFVTPFLAFVVWVVLMIRFAGFPYLSDVWRQQTERMFYVVIVWTAGQLIAGTMTTIWTYDEGDWMQKDDYVWFSLSVALTLVCSEIIPLIYTSDWRRVGYLLLAFSDWRDLWIKDERRGMAHDPRLMDDPLRTSHHSLNLTSPSINTPHQSLDELKFGLLSVSSPLSDTMTGSASTHTLTRNEFNSIKVIKLNGKNGKVDFSALSIDNTVVVPPYVYGTSNVLYSTHRASIKSPEEEIRKKSEDGTHVVPLKGNIADLHAADLDEIEFCLKIFQCDAIDSPAILQGVYDNLMKIKKLEHEHLAIIYAVNLKKDKHSGIKHIEILSPWYNGGSLYDIILMSPKDTPFAMHVIKRMMLQVAHFMDWLHTKCKIVHGHLKSRNILFNHEMNVCVTDIGLRGLKNRMSVLCPECCFDGYWMDKDYFMGKVITSPCDVWAFGFIIYELIAKRSPFEDESLDYIKKCIINGDMPLLPKHCDPFLNDLVQQCWNEDRSKRPTFRQIVDQIQKEMS